MRLSIGITEHGLSPPLTVPGTRGPKRRAEVWDAVPLAPGFFRYGPEVGLHGLLVLAPNPFVFPSF